MKKVKKFVFGGLQQKIFNLCVITVIVTVVIFGLIGVTQLKQLQRVAAESGEAQTESISRTSGAIMSNVVSSSLSTMASLKAKICNQPFESLAEKIELLAGETERLYADSESFGSVSVEIPDAKNAGEISVQLISGGGDLSDRKLRQEAGLLGNLSDMMSAVVEQSDEVLDCFVFSETGIILIADYTSDQKFDENGDVIWLNGKERPWYERAVEEGGLIWTDLEKDGYTGEPIVMCAVPVYVDDELVAVCGASLSLANIETSVVSADLGEGGFACVLNSQGQVVFSPVTEGMFAFSENEESADLRESEGYIGMLITNAVGGGSGVEMVDVDGEGYYIAYNYIDAIGWTQLLLLPQSTVDAPADLMIDNLSEISSSTTQEYTDEIKKISAITFIILVVIIASAVAASLILARRIVKPIDHMTKRIGEIGGDELVFKLEPIYNTGDEIEFLAKAFARLSEQTVMYIKNITEITAEKERIGAELNVATNIQASMLPNLYPAFPERDEFDLYASMDPAKEVGGDFYDFFMVDDDHIALVMADVSGKGVPAALFMMISMVLIRTRTQIGGSTSEILAKVNDQLCETNEEGLFVTVWMAIVDINTGHVVESNAGHEYPTIMRAGGEFELIKTKHSPAVATMEGMNYKEWEYDLNPGDRLFVYTDGVPEATNAKNELFGTDRMLDALNADKDADNVQLLKNVRKAVDEFVGDAPQFDDLTMLAFTYYGKKE